MLRSIFIILSIYLYSLSSFAAGENRPFWTEQSSFLEGNMLFGVGVASKVASSEEGRVLAFENAKQELLNFIQLADLGDVNIYTQMTYEESNSDGSLNVFRLIKVDYSRLKNWKKQQVQLAKANLDNQRMYQELEIATQEKHIAQRQKNIEQMLSNQQKIEILDAEFSRIMTSIDSAERRACRFVKLGMTRDEVLTLAGEPRIRNQRNRAWRYGSISVNFRDGVVDNFDGHKFVVCR